MLNKNEPLVALDAEAALHRLRAGEALRGYHIIGLLDLLSLSPDYTYFPYPLIIENCRVDNLQGGALEYQLTVKLHGTQFGQASFFFGYFPKGLLIEHCLFEHYLDFQAGGHNKPGFPVQLLHNTFNGFVNFFDCWYEADVQVEHNAFRAGTNLLGAPANIPVTIDGIALIRHNTGDLTRNDEGPDSLSIDSSAATTG